MLMLAHQVNVFSEKGLLLPLVKSHDGLGRELDHVSVRRSFVQMRQPILDVTNHLVFSLVTCRRRLLLSNDRVWCRELGCERRRTSDLLDEEEVAVDPRLLVLLESLKEPRRVNHTRDRILHVLQGRWNRDDLLDRTSETLCINVG